MMGCQDVCVSGSSGMIPVLPEYHGTAQMAVRLDMAPLDITRYLER